MNHFPDVDFSYVDKKKRELLAERRSASAAAHSNPQTESSLASSDSADHRVEEKGVSAPASSRGDRPLPQRTSSPNDRVEAALREMKGDGADVSHRVPAESKMDRAIEMLRAAGDQGDREPQRAPTGSRVDETLKMYRPSNAS